MLASPGAAAFDFGSKWPIRFLRRFLGPPFAAFVDNREVKKFNANERWELLRTDRSNAIISGGTFFRLDILLFLSDTQMPNDLHRKLWQIFRPRRGSGFAVLGAVVVLTSSALPGRQQSHSRQGQGEETQSNRK